MGKLIKYMLLAALCAVAATRAEAQFSIGPGAEAEPGIVDATKQMPDITDPSFLAPIVYETAEMKRAARIQRRRERNVYDITPKAIVSMTSYSDWAKDAQDAFIGKLELRTNYTHKRSRFSYTNKVDARIGMMVFDSIKFKDEDWFEVKNTFRYDISKNWSYAATVDFRSQFTKGYKSGTDKTLVSNFMAPATLNVGVGVTWTPKWGLKLDIMPVSGKMTFISSQQLADRGIVKGMDKGSKFKPELGSLVKFEFNRAFVQDIMRYKSDFNMFYNFRLSPVARWNNTLSVRMLKHLSTDISWEVAYDESAMAEEKKHRVQFHYTVQLTFSHTIKSRK